MSGDEWGPPIEVRRVSTKDGLVLVIGPLTEGQATRETGSRPAAMPSPDTKHYTGPHRPLPDGRCEHRWANRLLRAVHCGFPAGIEQERARVRLLMAQASSDNLEDGRTCLPTRVAAEIVEPGR